MLAIGIALAVLGGCTAVRWYLDRSSLREETVWRGRVRLKSLWNEGAAFGLPVPPELLAAASAAALGVLWHDRKRAPAGVGLVLGGGLSNLWERLRRGKVYDYIQFPNAPGQLSRYVFNLADIAILTGCVLWVRRRRK